MKTRATIAPLVFATLTLLMFFDVLFSASRVISSETTDLAMQFIPWREFGFSQLRQGNLPLWNPHIYGGAPYFAGFQSALLYPPNWLHLILPVGAAINWIVALHVFLAGQFTYLWCRGRGIGLGGSILAGVMFMFAGPYFLHVYAGHLPHLCVMVWIPLMLLSLDKLANTGDVRWGLLGISAAALHILAGHPQYVYYTGIALTLYTALRLGATRHRLKLIGGFIAMYVGATLLTAIQLFPGLQAASEQVRSGGTDFNFAAMFSLPPQNLLTLLAPAFFGNVPLDRISPPMQSYWGTCYLWEMSLFVSVTGLVLAVLGAIRGPRRSVWIPAVLVLVTLILALGRHTPLYKPMFDLLPMYGSFRGTSKFTALTLPFLCLLAAHGFDTLLQSRKNLSIPACAIAATGIILLILGLILPRSDTWPEVLTWVRNSAQISPNVSEWYNQVSPDDPAFQRDSARSASTAMSIAAATLLLVGALIWSARFHRLVPYALLLIATVEMFTFARFTRATMKLSDAYVLPEPWSQPLSEAPPDQRVLTREIGVANLGMAMGFNNLAGYDPGVSKRYAELMFASQGVDSSNASQYIPWRQMNVPVYRMYRCGLVCYDAQRSPAAVPSPLPPAVLVSDYLVMDSRDLILSYITREGYDPATTVVLETQPGIQTTPAAAPPGTVEATQKSTDEIEIVAELTRPAILVLTENFSTGWRVTPIESNQPQYRIQPANWAQMAIPLHPGRHRLLVEYLPKAFLIGRRVSFFALLAFAVTSFLLMRRARHAR